MPTKRASFSDYLLQKGLITKEQLEKALAIQNKKRLMGALALELGFLNENEVQSIKEFQENRNTPFGEAAISLGLLTRSQIKYLLDVRLRRKIRIGDILIKEGFIEREKLYDALMSFEKNRHRIKKILICDSSSIVNSLLKKLLTKYGYEVSVVEKPSEVLKIAAREKPSLLIISQVFEQTTGLEVCAKLLSRQDMAALNIIFMAQDIDQKLIEETFETGIHHFLKKPIVEHELLNIIYSIEQEEQEKRKEKVLVVEDSDLIRNTMVRELKQRGYNVFQAACGEDAIPIAKREKPNLITLDIIMPGIDGYETCRRLRVDPDTHDIPVIMVTSCDTVEERMKGFEVGAVEYFAKPFSPDQLVNYIRMLFETKQAKRKDKAVVIEDTRTTLHIIKHILEKQGIEVVSAENGKEGMEKIRQSSPDIILSDIYMPVMDGFEVCREVKKSRDTKHIPIILLTSSGKKEDNLQGLAMGANDFLIKPFDEEELLARLNNLLANKNLYEELKTVNSKLESLNLDLAKFNKELEQKNEELKRMGKEKESFYSILTHDLRSPLSSVLGFTGLLQEDFEKNLDETGNEYLKLIKSSAERQLGIIEDALEIFRMETGKGLEKIEGDMGSLVHEVLLTQTQRIEERKLEVTVNKKKYSRGTLDSLPCLFDRIKITRVVENLIGNAAKYANKKIDIAYGSKGGLVQFSVCDDGSGIPEKYREKLFQDFYQVPGSKKGTGLGLSSAKRIVEVHGGKIWADPSPGQCSFSFTLPR